MLKNFLVAEYKEFFNMLQNLKERMSQSYFCTIFIEAVIEDLHCLSIPNFT